MKLFSLPYIFVSERIIYFEDPPENLLSGFFKEDLMKIVVLCGGKVSGIVDGRSTNKYEVGSMMTTLGGGEAR